MPKSQTTLNIATIEQAEQELKKIKSSKICIKLMAIIALKENSIETICSFFKINRMTLYRWAKKFSENGVNGLKDLSKGHNPSKLEEEHKLIIRNWIVTGKDSCGNSVNWTLKRLQKELKKEFQIEISVMPLWTHLKKMRLAVKKPRPTREKTDKKIQEDFKKNS